MSKGPVTNFTTTSSLPGGSPGGEAPDAAEMTATRFGNFEVLTLPDGGLHLLGGGGFGKTYKARHVFLNQVVALKVINDRFLHDLSAKERFLREAQVVHQLRHPHIAHVLDFGEVKTSLYYAMEYCGGGNLENMVSRLGPLPLPVVVRCARQLAEALGCAHSHGFIHRDVKPANVMLTSVDDGNPMLKLVDFGLVKHLQGNSSEATAALTMTGQQFFTIQFASPEQLMEEELDARSDLFALGMTLWFLLKGAPPESGSMASIVAKRLDAKPYEPLLPAGLPPAYRALLARLLEKDRNQRIQNTDEFLAALAAAEAAPDVVPGGEVSGADEPETELLSAEERAAEPEPEPVAPAGPLSLTETYAVLENLGSTPLGVMYRATRNEDGEPVAITIVSDTLREDPTQWALIRDNVGKLRTRSHEAIARIFGLEEYQEGWALIQEWHQGVSLHSILKNARFLSYDDALHVLQPIAEGADANTVAGLPGVMMALDEIYLQPTDREAHPEPEKLLEVPLRQWPEFRVRLLPYVVREETAQDVGMTLNTEIVSNPTVAFGCLMYHLVAGHAPKNAAKLTKNAYVTIGRLQEDSNRLLASCIVDERDFGGCMGMLRTLSQSEGKSYGGTTTRQGGARSGTTGGGGVTTGGGAAVDVPARPSTTGVTGAHPALGRTSLPNTTTGRKDPGTTSTPAPILPTTARTGGTIGTRRIGPTPGTGNTQSGATTGSCPPLVPTRPTEQARINAKAVAPVTLPPAPPPAAPPPVPVAPVVPPDLTRQKRPSKPTPAAIAPPPPPQGPPADNPPPIVTPPPAEPTFTPDALTGGGGGAQPSPIVWIAAITGVVLVVAVAGFFLLRKPAPVAPPRPEPSPTPVARATATPKPVVVSTPVPTPVATPTPTPAPKDFVFAQGFAPAHATVTLKGRVISVSGSPNGRVSVPLGGAGPGDKLMLEAKGYEPMPILVGQEATVSSHVELRRQQGAVKFTFEKGKSDYTTAVFKHMKALAGEEAFVQTNGDDTAVDLGEGNPMEKNFPTGIYRVTLQGPGGATDRRVQQRVIATQFPLPPGPARAFGVPPSFAGQYNFEFEVKFNKETIRVLRTIVIDPGLNGGHADDQYPASPNAKPAKDTKVTDLSIDDKGTLHGRIRFSLRAPGDNLSYDEQFEISNVDGRFMIVGGNWEVPTADPLLTQAIKKELGEAYRIHTTAPSPRPVNKD